MSDGAKYPMPTLTELVKAARMVTPGVDGPSKFALTIDAHMRAVVDEMLREHNPCEHESALVKGALDAQAEAEREMYRLRADPRIKLNLEDVRVMAREHIRISKDADACDAAMRTLVALKPPSETPVLQARPKTDWLPCPTCMPQVNNNHFYKMPHWLDGERGWRCQNCEPFIVDDKDALGSHPLPGPDECQCIIDAGDQAECRIHNDDFNDLDAPGMAEALDADAAKLEALTYHALNHLKE